MPRFRVMGRAAGWSCIWLSELVVNETPVRLELQGAPGLKALRIRKVRGTGSRLKLAEAEFQWNPAC